MCWLNHNNYIHCEHPDTVCAEIFTVLNFCGCIILRIFTDFIFAVVDHVYFIPYIQYKLVYSIMVSSLILYEPYEQLKVEQPFQDLGFHS